MSQIECWTSSIIFILVIPDSFNHFTKKEPSWRSLILHCHHQITVLPLGTKLHQQVHVKLQEKFSTSLVENDKGWAFSYINQSLHKYFSSTVWQNYTVGIVLILKVCCFISFAMLRERNENFVLTFWSWILKPSWKTEVFIQLLRIQIWVTWAFKTFMIELKKNWIWEGKNESSSQGN